MKKIFLVLSIATFFSVSLAHAADYPFYRYLAKGYQGTDVKLLQQNLNATTSTQVALTGPGSPGNETSYFGELTRQAVLKLQGQNKLNATGVLDDPTRAYLNANNLLTATPTPETLNSSYQKTIIFSNQPRIDSISPKTVKDGDRLTIKGANFSTSSKNTIHVTYNSVATTSLNGTELTFKFSSDLQKMFDKQADKADLSDDEKDDTAKKISEIPVFVTVQNSVGVSNPYQIKMKIK